MCYTFALLHHEIPVNGNYKYMQGNRKDFQRLSKIGNWMVIEFGFDEKCSVCWQFCDFSYYLQKLFPDSNTLQLDVIVHQGRDLKKTFGEKR